ncbi:MAG: HigA family addiction module antidote protein [Firmicutes bacterium]|nr:HigA family addiction module antidote protein [Bacillota bacterium]
MVRSRNIIATPPGSTIKEQLSDRGLSQKEFAKRMDMSEKHISQLINGRVRLTHDVAIKLEMVLGIPAKFWNNLEAIYREKLIKANEENDMADDVEIAKKMPYSEMANNGWVAKTKKAEEKVINLRKFFEVVSLKLLENSQITKIACRRLTKTEKSDYALIAWGQQAKIEARNVQTSAISIKRLIKIIPDIRLMTMTDPYDFCPKLEQMLADCGIALIFLPYIKSSFLHGATFNDGDKIVIGITVRGKDADKFWFSLFHEFAHIIYGHIRNSNGTTKEDEDVANEFARNTLIPQNNFEDFLLKKDFSKEAIIQFADDIKIDPGIVVGRLQKDKHIDYSVNNDLKTKYALSSD